MFHEIRNTASFEIFECIKNIALKLFQKFHEKIISIQILNEYAMTIMERRALVFIPRASVGTHLISLNY